MLCPCDLDLVRTATGCLRHPKTQRFRASSLQEATHRNNQGQFDVVDVLRLLMASVRKVLQGNAWASSIDECGYFAHAKGAGSQVRALFGRADCAALTTQTERPTAIRITEMLPKKQVYAVNARWWTCVQMFTALSLPLFTR